MQIRSSYESFSFPDVFVLFFLELQPKHTSLILIGSPAIIFPPSVYRASDLQQAHAPSPPFRPKPINPSPFIFLPELPRPPNPSCRQRQSALEQPSASIQFAPCLTPCPLSYACSERSPFSSSVSCPFLPKQNAPRQSTLASLLVFILLFFHSNK